MLSNTIDASSPGSTTGGTTTGGTTTDSNYISCKWIIGFVFVLAMLV